MYVPSPRNPPHHTGSETICTQSGGNTQHQDNSNSSYFRVNREWDLRDGGRRAEAERSGYGQTGNERTMLQRWQQESISDQPYHNLDAAKKRTDFGTGR